MLRRETQTGVYGIKMVIEVVLHKPKMEATSRSCKRGMVAQIRTYPHARIDFEIDKWHENAHNIMSHLRAGVKHHDVLRL